MTAASVLLDLLSCCAAGTELFGNEPQSDFCDSCSFFFPFSLEKVLAACLSSWLILGAAGVTRGRLVEFLSNHKNSFPGSLRSLWLKTKLLSSKKVLPT